MDDGLAQQGVCGFHKFGRRCGGVGFAGRAGLSQVAGFPDGNELGGCLMCDDVVAGGVVFLGEEGQGFERGGAAGWLGSSSWRVVQVWIGDGMGSSA